MSYLTNNYYYITCCLNESCKSQFKRGEFLVYCDGKLKIRHLKIFKINMWNMETSQILENFKIFFEKII